MMTCGVLPCSNVQTPSGCAQIEGSPTLIYNCTNPALGNYSVSGTPVVVVNQTKPTRHLGCTYYAPCGGGNTCLVQNSIGPCPPPDTYWWGTVADIQVTVYSPRIPRAQVLIVTEGGGDGLCGSSTLQSYNSVLAKQGLSSLCLDLDDDQYTNLTGQLPNVGSWQAVKSQINLLESASGAQYLVILGDASVVPMPSVPAFGPDTTSEMKELNTPDVIPTDDPYGYLAAAPNPGNYCPCTPLPPSVIVGRIPGSTQFQISQFLKNAINERQNKNTNISAFADNSLVNALFYFSNHSSKSCGSSKNLVCLYSPSACLFGPNFPTFICSASAKLISAMQSSAMQFYACHGDGFSCGSEVPFAEIVPYVSEAQIPAMSLNPIIFSVSCFGAVLYGSVLYGALLSVISTSPANGAPSMSVKLMDAGASVYIGETVQGIVQISPSIYGTVYNTWSLGGTTIGQNFLQAKIAEEDRTLSGDIIDQGIAMQLYGDPTLQYP
jgi:hypothetical protein